MIRLCKQILNGKIAERAVGWLMIAILSIVPVLMIAGLNGCTPWPNSTDPRGKTPEFTGNQNHDSNTLNATNAAKASNWMWFYIFAGSASVAAATMLEPRWSKAGFAFSLTGGGLSWIVMQASAYHMYVTIGLLVLAGGFGAYELSLYLKRQKGAANA